jgi:hypothetical protein
MMSLFLTLGTVSALSLPEVESSLVDYAVQSCGAEKVEVSWLGLSASLPGASESKLIWSGNPCQSRPMLKLRAVEQGQLVGSWRFRPALDIWKKVPVAAADYAPDQKVDSVSGLVRLSDIQGNSVAEGAWLARVSISSGEALTDRVLRRAPDSVRGSSVRVEARAGALVVGADGKLLEDAFLGEEVRVLNLATRSTQRGRFTAGNRVVLEH